jgi:uncharacterized protein YprB with RNaseH-like and TPR domain
MSFLGRLERLKAKQGAAGAPIAPTAPLTTPLVTEEPPLSPSADALSSAPPRDAVLDDLRERMQRMLRKEAPRESPKVSVTLPFEHEERSEGTLHVLRERVSPGHKVGRISTVDARFAAAELLSVLALDPSLAACRPEGALFLDTETTGLSHGAGTVAFLVGLAYFQGGTLVLEQLFLQGLGDEAPMLARLRELMAQASMLVTFNGKAFDLPLLRTRYRMAKEEPPVEPPHLDLLHVARRVHAFGRPGRRALRLVHLDDVASADVAACYLHYLRTGDVGLLGSVVSHNAWDVYTMAALMGLYGEPLTGRSLSADDLIGVAHTMYRAGDAQGAVSTASMALEAGAAPTALFVRAQAARRLGDAQAALSDLELLIDKVEDPKARLELAKLYEHHVKDPMKALGALDSGSTAEKPEAADRRRTRLRRKARLS